ncbi:MAG: CotH kinase family protein, partial [SAR202 cluster bacterium]|nr:CotH kinase family protein [SAR202 cluster bacterium]
MRKPFLFIILFALSFTSFSQDVFDIGIRKIEIFFSETNWDDTLDVYYANDIGQRLIADSVIIDGEVDQDVGVKYKGNSSYNVNNSKNPLNIKLDYVNNGQSIDGYNVLKLSNGFRDPSFVREVMTYEMAREYIPASKATYANVFINGIWNGLYTCVQSVDDDFTNEHFYERKGPFFKADNTGVQVPNCSAGQNGIWKYFTDTNCLQKAYEMQSSNDWTQLGNFLDTINNHFSEVEKVLDEDRTLWMMAFSNLTITLDGPINNIPHNFYMFKDNNDNFSPIIWDLNGSFGTFKNGLTTPVTTQDLQELDIFHESTNNQNKMCTQMFSSDQYKRMYVAHMRTILNEQFANNDYSTRALQLQTIIDSSVNADPNGFYSHAEFISNINSSVGTQNSIVGITELMGSRISFI